MSIQSDLLDHIRRHVPEQATLAAHLGGDGRVCCYYVCPLSTLRMIVREGIKCRSSQPVCVDLSSPDVQSRRKTVWVGLSDRSGRLRKRPDVPIHSCLNLFWNPCNQTFDAFQRNGLLRAAEKNDSEHGLMCLLEIDAERLLNEADVYWTATKGNAASGGFASFEMQHLRQFPWPKTYAVGPYTVEFPWQPRAAELIVYVDPSEQGHSKPIPPSCFGRIILSSNAELNQQQQDWLSRAGLPIHRADVFKSPSDLLKCEGLFVRDCETYRQSDIFCVDRLVAAFRMVTEFESRFGGPTLDRFESSALAHSQHHGMGHVARVMFWSAFLATYPYGLKSTNQHTAAFLTALLHDLGRQGQLADCGHGERSLEKHRRLIEQALDDPQLREACASAVRLHDVDDADCPVDRRDRFWELLKDADGLERGRFSRPDNERGCNPSMLRFGYLDDATSARRNLPWLAYFFAGITKHGQWDDRPCRRLLTDFCCGLNAGLPRNLFWGRKQVVAKKLHGELSGLCAELATADRWQEMSAAYADYVEGLAEEDLLDQEEKNAEWQEWLDTGEDNNWDDHDMESGERDSSAD